MMDGVHSMTPVRQAAAGLRPRAGVIALAAIGFAVAGWMAGDPLMQAVLVLVAGTLLATAVWVLLLHRSETRSLAGDRAQFARLLEHDTIPCFVTRADGGILYRNPAASATLPGMQAETLAGALQGDLANPGAILFRLQSRASAPGAAQEDLVTRRGHMRLSVHRSGEGAFLWRYESSADRPPPGADPVPLPMLTVGRKDTVLFMNAAARQLVGERVRTLERLCPALPLRSGQVNPILTRDGVIACLVVELEGMASRREVFLLPDMAAPECQAGWLAAVRRSAGAAAQAGARWNGADVEPSGARPARGRKLRGQGAWRVDGRSGAVDLGLAGRCRGRARNRPFGIHAHPPRRQGSVRAGHAEPCDRRGRNRSDRGAERRHQAEIAGGAIRSEPENAGHRATGRWGGA
ncbi:MAG: hypothetical protein R8G60_01560 [Roseovarius pacificus]|nr:hypothetical protein [Roseovarius pacificus]